MVFAFNFSSENETKSSIFIFLRLGSSINHKCEQFWMGHVAYCWREHHLVTNLYITLFNLVPESPSIYFFPLSMVLVVFAIFKFLRCHNNAINDIFLILKLVLNLISNSKLLSVLNVV